MKYLIVLLAVVALAGCDRYVDPKDYKRVYDLCMELNPGADGRGMIRFCADKAYEISVQYEMPDPEAQHQGD